MLGTDKGKRYSKSYNEDILLHTIVHAMVAQLKRPSSGFEDVIRTHFRIKKKRILKVVFYVLQCVQKERQPMEGTGIRDSGGHYVT